MHLQQFAARRPGAVDLAPEYAYCIDPEYITASLTVSLERLGLTKLDVLLLHRWSKKAEHSSVYYYSCDHLYSPESLLQHQIQLKLTEFESSSNKCSRDSPGAEAMSILNQIGAADSSKDSAMRFIPPAVLAETRQELLQHIRRAFAALEQERRSGRIGCYGISSDGECAVSLSLRASSHSKELIAINQSLLVMHLSC